MGNFIVATNADTQKTWPLFEPVSCLKKFTRLHNYIDNRLHKWGIKANEAKYFHISFIMNDS